MSGATTRYGLPYPTGGDPVVVHADVQALSQKVDVELGAVADAIDGRHADLAGEPAWGISSEDGTQVHDIIRRDGGLCPTPVRLLKDDLGLSRQTATQHVRCIGTSLTAGPDTTPYPSYLASDFGMSMTNHGWAGRNSFVLASTWNALPFLTTAPITIPTTGSVTVDLSWEYGGGADAYIAGIRGSLVRVTATQATFTPHTYPASPVVVPAGSQVHKIAVNDYSDSIFVIEMSRNDGTAYTAGATISHVRGLIRAVTRRTLVPHVLVLGEPLATTDTGSQRAYRAGRNTEMRSAFPDLYVDAFEWLLTDEALTYVGVTPTAQDDIDRAAGITPASLRRDTLHPNSLGNKAIAKRVHDAMSERGWVA